MKKPQDKPISTDDIAEKALAALREASEEAWNLSVATGTPFIVWQDGKVVDLNPETSGQAPTRKSRKQAVWPKKPKAGSRRMKAMSRKPKA